MSNLENKVTNLSLHLMEMRNKYKQYVDEYYEKYTSGSSASIRKEAQKYMFLYQGKADMCDALITNLDSGLYNQSTELFLSNFLLKK